MASRDVEPGDTGHRAPLGERFWSTLAQVSRNRLVAASPVIGFGAGVIFGWATAPPYGTFYDHSFYSPLFSTAAQVIATLFVAFALGGRFYLASIGQAAVTILFIAVAEIAAVAALSPTLPHGAYAPLLGVTIGGGVGALLAAALTAGRAAVQAGEESQRHKLTKFGGGTAT
jgi:hypothetical protein